MKRTYGSIFTAYRPECYYYDILDLTRRLILTGGLIMIGNEEAVAQILMGILVSAVWLCLVLWKRPYAAHGDNMLSAMLSFEIMCTLLCGQSLRLYEFTKTGADDVEQDAFGAVLVAANAVCLVLCIMSILLSTDAMRNRVIHLFQDRAVRSHGVKARAEDLPLTETGPTAAAEPGAPPPPAPPRINPTQIVPAHSPMMDTDVEAALPTSQGTRIVAGNSGSQQLGEGSREDGAQ